VRTVLFGERLRRLAEDSAAPRDEAKRLKDLAAELQGTDSKTALADAISESVSGGGAIAGAVVVVTDGGENAGQERLSAVALRCGEKEIPLYIYGVGVTERKDLHLKEVDVAPTLFFEDHVSVPIRWRCRGIDSGTLELTLALAGQVVAQRDVPVRAGEDIRETLSFVPKKSAGLTERADLTVSIRLKDDSTVAHKLLRRVRVVDQKIKVLYVENTPRWEYKYLQSTLLRDRRVEASFLLAAGDRTLSVRAGRTCPRCPPAKSSSLST